MLSLRSRLFIRQKLNIAIILNYFTSHRLGQCSILDVGAIQYGCYLVTILSFSFCSKSVDTLFNDAIVTLFQLIFLDTSDILESFRIVCCCVSSNSLPFSYNLNIMLKHIVCVSLGYSLPFLNLFVYLFVSRPTCFPALIYNDCPQWQHTSSSISSRPV
jgi:hypothetical protein